MKNTAFTIQTLDTYYGLTIYRIEDAQFAIALDENDAYAAAREYLEDFLWGFDLDLLLEFVKDGVTLEVLEALVALNEAANDTLALLIDDEDSLFTHVIERKGFGSILAPYDSEEIEVCQQSWYDSLKEHISEENGSVIDIIDALAFRIK